MVEKLEFVFMVCSERSGSNLLVKMMDGHSNVCGPTPSHIIRTLSLNLARYGELSDEANWYTLLQDTTDLLDCQLGKWRTRWSIEKLSEGIQERSLKALVRHIYEEEARAAGKAMVFVKENRTHMFATFLLSAFPGARFVYLVRDPRDMALSWKRSSNHPGGVTRAVDIWHEDQKQAILMYSMLRDYGKIYVLRYEDLISEPEAELSRLCGFLGIGFEKGMLEFYREPLTVDNSKAIKDWENLGRPVLRDNKGKYRAGLDENEVRYVEAICAEEMAVFGYGCDFPPADAEALRESLMVHEASVQDEKPPLSHDEEDARARRIEVITRIAGRGLIPIIQCNTEKDR